MNETAKERMERYRKEWHIKRAVLNGIIAQLRSLQEEWQIARVETDAAHEGYKYHKAVWRTGREWNVEDADNAALIHKLQQR